MDWGDIKKHHKENHHKEVKPYEYPNLDTKVTNDEINDLSLAC